MGSQPPVRDGGAGEGWSLDDLDELEALRDENDRSLTNATVSTDELFCTLAEARNRYVLTYLLLVSRPVPCYELVEYVVRETEPPDGYTRAEFRGRVLTELLDATCPKLDDIGLVEFDEKNQIVSETDQTIIALPHLRLALKRADLSGPD
jgi:hypothetical protein